MNVVTQDNNAHNNERNNNNNQNDRNNYQRYDGHRYGQRNDNYNQCGGFQGRG